MKHAEIHKGIDIMNLNELKKVVADAGVVGAGGAGFPTQFKFNEGLDTLIINGAECEPLIFSDYYIMKKEMQQMLDGAEMVIEAMKLKNGYLGIKEHTAERLGFSDGQKLSAHVVVHVLPNVYPMGDEIILIYEVTKRIVAPGSLPFTQGVIVSNVETLYNVANAAKGIPVTEKYVTIGGKIDDKCRKVVKIPVGVPVSELFAYLGVTVPDDCVVIDGGPAMGNIIDPKTYHVTKTTKSFLILPKHIPAITGKTTDPDNMVRRSSSTCCQCSMCTDMCPRALIGYPLKPHKIVRVVNGEITSNPQDYLAASVCSSCGVCELTACCQGISPRMVYTQVKKSLAKNGLRYQHDGSELKADPQREYRMLPSDRFMARIGVAPYDIMPELTGTVSFKPSSVYLPMRQHVGKPAAPAVNVGDVVKAGDLVGKAADGISANIHATVNGVVTAVSDQAITIQCD